MGELLFHECLGRGGYGEVYRATWSRADSAPLPVAVKLLNAAFSQGSEAQQRLRDEAHLLSSIRHPRILRVYDLVELGGHVAMLAEYVRGEDLDQCLGSGFGARALLEVVAAVADALAAAWSTPASPQGKPLRLVHRDIKPENIRLTPDGDVRLLDFGVARATEVEREAKTATNTVMGSYRYMAPERFDDQLEPHPSVDVFALGCILYEGLAGSRLFQQLSMREMMLLSVPDNQRFESWIDERVSRLPDATPPELIELLLHTLARDPNLRPMPRELSELYVEAATNSVGGSLAAWAHARSWPDPPPTEGAWTGVCIELDTSASLIAERLGPAADRPTLPFIAPTSDAEPTLEPEPLGRSRPPLDVPSGSVTRDAVDALSVATSTPGAPRPRLDPDAPDQRRPSDPRPGQPPSSAAPQPHRAPAESPVTVAATSEDDTTTTADALDVDALRRAIGLRADDAEPRSPEPAAHRSPSAPGGAVMANLIVLGLVLLIGALVLVAWLVVSLR